MKFSICKKCNKSISNNNILKHEKSCQGKKLDYSFLDGKSVCPTCSKSFNTTKSLKSHYWRVHTNEGIIHNPNKGYDNERKGTNQFIKGSKTHHSIETKKKLSIYAIKNPQGIAKNETFRATNGRGLKVHYIDSFNKECLLESSWEWLMANNLDKNNIKWKRAWTFWLSENNGSYTPDFYLPEYDVYLDPKAWHNEKQDKRIKLWKKQYHKKLIIINNEKDLTWEYVRSFL